MWISETWDSQQDVELDILRLAEYNVPSPEDPDSDDIPIPDTILEYRRRMASNKEKTLNSDIDETAAYIVSGRGKGIRDRVLRPGGNIECHPYDEIQLKKQIREVSGFGYSNELIEQSIKARSYDPDKNGDNSNFKLVPSSSSSTSSSKSSLNTTPIKKQKDMNVSVRKEVLNTTPIKKQRDTNDSVRKEEFPPLKRTK